MDERTLLVVDDHGFWRALDKAYYKCIICILIALLICGSLPSLSTLPKYLYYAIIVFALIVALLIPASMTYIIDRKAHSKLNLFTRWALVNWRHISVGSSSIKATYGRFISKGFVMRGFYRVKNKFIPSTLCSTSIIEIDKLRKGFTLISNYNSDYISMPAVKITEGPYKGVIIGLLSSQSIRLDVAPRVLELIVNREKVAEAKFKPHKEGVEAEILVGPKAPGPVRLEIWSIVSRRLGKLDIIKRRKAKICLCKVEPGRLGKVNINPLGNKEIIILTHERLYNTRYLLKKLALPNMLTAGFSEGTHMMKLKLRKHLNTWEVIAEIIASEEYHSNKH